MNYDANGPASKGKWAAYYRSRAAFRWYWCYFPRTNRLAKFRNDKRRTYRMLDKIEASA